MLQIGQLVDNKYRILDVVGRGGMSVVYLARNERANKNWAIKEVRKIGEENLEVKKNSLIAETEMLKNLSHPNLPTIVDVIETNDTFLVVMDYIEGNDLGKVLGEFGAQPQKKVVEWGLQLCDVLEYLHTRPKPIIYRDLKPANIMLKPNGKDIMLIDFGTAREVKIADANDTISLGTRGYAAPEQFGANAKTDARTDIYCLGATMYHLVTNHNPATEPYVMAPIRERNPSLSAGLEQIILKCTQNDPDKRYQSCAELMYALEHYETIDDEYKKKQQRKLGVFIGSVLMIFVSLGVALFGHLSAQSKRAEDIDTYLAEAKNESASRAERVQAYHSGIALEPGDRRFYEGLLELYRNTDNNGAPTSNGELSLEEVTDLDSLGMTGANKIKPLEAFMQRDKEGYEEFCKETGTYIWYNYDSAINRENKASEWFDRFLKSRGEDDDGEDTQFVRLYSRIADCRRKQSARKTDNKKKYKELWDNINELYTYCETCKDDETVALGCREIVKELEGQSAFFVDVDGVSDSDLYALLDKTQQLVEATYKRADNSIRKYMDEQFSEIDSKGEKSSRSEFFRKTKLRMEKNLKGR